MLFVGWRGDGIDVVRRRGDKTRVEEINGDGETQKDENRTEGIVLVSLLFVTRARGRAVRAIPAAAAAVALVTAAAAEP